jgi:hypothetical protein
MSLNGTRLAREGEKSDKLRFILSINVMIGKKKNKEIDGKPQLTEIRKNQQGT